MKQVTVGMADAGWAGGMHARSYRKIHGTECRLKTVCALEPDLDQFAHSHGFEKVTSNFSDLLADPEIDLIDIVTPPALHADMAIAALRAGKHIVCEKPLTGYFANRSDDGPRHPEIMLESAMKNADAIGEAMTQSGKRVCYAENWIYSPPFVRMLELLTRKQTRVLLIEGATGHSGSHSPQANYWKDNGGGALIRQGSHPLAAALHLKRAVQKANNLDYGITSVYSDCARLTEIVPEPRHLAARPVDVEDWARVIVTFFDGSKADIMAGDILLGNIVNSLAVHGSDAAYRCNMTPNNLLEAYYADAERLEGEQVMEKASHNAGWMNPLVAQEFIRGYEGQLQDFVESVADDREPVSGFALARETLAVMYAAYVSAETGRAVDMWSIL